MDNLRSSSLNVGQEGAAKAPRGPLLIVAGAGTGKTTTLTSRLIHLIESGVPALKICAITFTNKAAREMKERCLLSSLRCQGAFIGTFHSFGANILRREARFLGRKPNFVIFDDHDSFDLIKKIVKKESGGSRESSSLENKEKPSFFSRKVSEIKNTDLALAELRASRKQKDELALKIYSIYESRLEENNAFDFDDLIEKVVCLFKKYPETLKKYQKKFEAVLVDEYQDLNPKQYEIIKFLAGDHKNLSVVGDDEQMIYGWRYANLKVFLGFEKDWPGAQIKFLEENYRSTGNIIEAASAVASRNNYRRPKNLWTKNPRGELISIFEASDENKEAWWIANKISSFSAEGGSAFGGQLPTSNKLTTAVLYRTNAQSRAIEQALIVNQIPYRIFGGLRFYERKEVKDVIAALRYATNKDEISFDRLQKSIPKRKFEKFEEKVKLAKNKSLSPAKWIEIFLKATDYLEHLEKDFINFTERQENIGELLVFAARFSDLHKFLEEVALMQPTDTLEKNGSLLNSSQYKAKTALASDKREVHLMTIHTSKGLEFDRVFIAGCSEKLLPHAMSMENEYSLEEERRLMYVAMTRARKKICISFYNTPSRFISELPAETIKEENHVAEDKIFYDEKEKYISLD